MKTSVSLMAFILFLFGNADAQKLCLAPPVDCGAKSEPTLEAVFERVPGQANGDSVKLQLHSMPAKNSSLTITRRDNEVIPPAEITVEGNTIILRGYSTQTAGEYFDVSYAILTGKFADSSNVSGENSVRAFHETSALLGLYLQRSLDEQLAAIEGNTAVVAAASSPTVTADRESKRIAEPTQAPSFIPASPRQLAEPNSIRMLRAGITASTIQSREPHGSGRRNVTLVTGYEGLGDEAMASPFAKKISAHDVRSSAPTVTHTTLPLQQGVLSLGSALHEQKVRPEPRSLTLLQECIDRGRSSQGHQ